MTTKNKEELLEQIEELQYENTQLRKCKRYGLVWEEKEEKFEKKAKNALPILKEKGEKFKDIIDKQNIGYDRNILIEGDNFHSLSVLNYTHRKKIDVIYIDPPYNTGNKDFIYNDHFVDKEDCFRHSKWLSFMSKRLKLSKSLLKDDGIIFISIGDNEQATLRLLCDEIFGEKNFIDNFIIRSNPRGNQAKKFTASEHEYLLCFAKNKESKSLCSLGFVKDEKEYKKEDEVGIYRELGLRKRGAGARRIDAPNQYFPIYFNAKTKEISVERFSVEDAKILPKLSDDSDGRWRWSKDSVLSRKKELLVRFVNRKKGKEYDVFQKDYFSIEKISKIKSILYEKEVNYENATEELKDIFDKKVFDYPKPTYLIYKILKSLGKDEGIVLDFMAGSGTTGHAVLALNKEDGGNRQFILCTNNENKICENVTLERIKRVSKGYKKQNGDKVEGLGGNLKYLKTDFIKIDNNSDNLKEKTVEASTEILCLKENTFNKVIDDYRKHKIKIFESKNKYTTILFDLFYFDEFVTELKKLKDKGVSIYVFSYTKDFSASEFGDLKIDFTVEAIPEKVLETYKKIFNF